MSNGPPSIGVRRPRSAVRARPAGHHDGGERGERHDQEDPGDGNGSGEATEVDHGDRDDGGDRHGAFMLGPQVGADGQRHRRTRRDLADDEPPSGEMTPAGAELPATVHVGAARLGVHRGELGRRGGVAEGDDRCDRQTDQQPATGGACRRCPGGEDAGADHRSGTDDHGVAHAEATLQRSGRSRRCEDPSRVIASHVDLIGVQRLAFSDWLVGRARRRCRTGPGAGSACRRVLPRRRCGTSRRRRGAVRPRRRGRRR